MTYRIFLSHGTEDTPIAEAIRDVLVAAFMENIDVFLATAKVKGGDEWEQEIRTALKSSNALISVFTKDSLHRPWLLLEWSAFWLHKKTYYVLLADDLSAEEIFEPMRQRQVTRLSDRDKVKLLWETLSTTLNCNIKPEEFVTILIESVQAARSVKHERSYAAFRDIAHPLPDSVEKKEQIAEFFISNREPEHLARICRHLRDQAATMRLARKLVDRRDAEMTLIVSEVIEDAPRVREIAHRMIDAGMSAEPPFRTLASVLATQDQAEYGRVLLHLIDNGEGDSTGFRHLAMHLVEMKVARKVAEHLVALGEGFRHSLPRLINLIGGANPTELRKLVTTLISRRLQREPVFEHSMTVLAIENQRELEKAMRVLWNADEATFLRILATGIVTSGSALARLRSLPHG